MDEKNFKALVKLLDDDDPMVSEHVWAKLSSLGNEGIERLEAEWEIQDNPIIQQKLEELIQQITLRDLGEELLEWRKAGGVDLLKGWFLLSRYRYPELNIQKYKNEFNRLVNKIWLEITPQMDPQERMRVVNHILFRMEGFGPNTDAPRNPENAFLNHLFDTKKGNATALGLLHLIISDKLDFPVKGVILPGYFVLIYLDGNKEFFIDPYNGGGFFGKSDLSRFLKEMRVEENPAYFKPTSNIYIILNMIKILIADYKAAGNEEKANSFQNLLDKLKITFD